MPLAFLPVLISGLQVQGGAWFDLTVRYKCAHLLRLSVLPSQHVSEWWAACQSEEKKKRSQGQKKNMSIDSCCASQWPGHVEVYWAATLAQSRDVAPPCTTWSPIFVISDCQTVLGLRRHDIISSCFPSRTVHPPSSAIWPCVPAKHGCNCCDEPVIRSWGL